MTPILIVSAAWPGSAKLEASSAAARNAFRTQSSRVMQPLPSRCEDANAPKRCGLDGGDRHLRAGLHLRERLRVARELAKDVARACKPRLVALADRRAPVAKRDAWAIRPVGDLAGRDDRARV